MQLPALSPDEIGLLRESIQRHGVINPVLLDRGGAVIDGTNRRAIATELGIECPTRTLDLDSEEAERLALELQLGRRNLDRDARDRFIAALRKTGMTQKAIADTVGIDQRTAGRVLNRQMPNEDAPDVVNKRGQKRPGQYATKNTAPPHVVRDRERKRQRQERYKEIREADQQSQLNSMRNAPAGSLNLPGLRRAREIRKLLRELSTLDPERFLTQVPREALGEFDSELAQWWLGFCDLAAAHAQTNGIPKARQAPPVAAPAMQTKLAPQQNDILVMLRQRGPMTADELANEIGTTAGSIGNAAYKLAKAGLLGVYRPVKGSGVNVYRATVPDPQEPEKS